MSTSTEQETEEGYIEALTVVASQLRREEVLKLYRASLERECKTRSELRVCRALLRRRRLPVTNVAMSAIQRVREGLNRLTSLSGSTKVNAEIVSIRQGLDRSVKQLQSEVTL